MPISRPRTYRAPRRTLMTLLLAGCLFLLAIGTATASAARPVSRSSVQASRSLPHALAVAASLSAQTDRTLVTKARALRACVRQNRTQPRRCQADRSAVQRAGSKLASAERRLAQIAGSTGRAAHASSYQRDSASQAPALTVSGQTLSWTRVGNDSTYLLMREVPGQPARYSIVDGTSTVPPPVPGATVRYAVRTTASWSFWSTERSITYPAASAPAPIPTPTDPPVTKTTPTEPPASTTTPTPPVDTQTAPTIKASGQSLTWSAVGSVSTYILAAITTSGGTQYSEVTGTSITPPAVPGVTVDYEVRTAVEGSAWSTTVSISYPAVEPTPTPAPTEPAPTEPAPTEPAPVSEASTFTPGLNAGTNMTLDVNGSVELGAKLVRIAFESDVTAAQMEPVIAGYAAKGIRVLPLFSFYGSMPTPTEARDLANWAKAYGPGGTYWSSHPTDQQPIQAIEFGNETSYSYQYGNEEASSPAYAARAEAYAVRFKEAAEAISTTGIKVGLLAQADNASGNWVKSMYHAVPNLSGYVAGWTIHPYGVGWQARLQDLINQTAAQGASATIPIDITEWGLSTDNGRCLSENYGLNRCMTYSEAATTVTNTVSEMRKMLGSRLNMFLLYSVRDEAVTGTSTEREAYFGALQHELQPKGAYTTAVQALLAS
jgi:hypothetical protein